MLLALVASIAGVFVAFWTKSIASKVQPAPIASQTYSILDGRVLSFAIGIAVLSGLLFGVLPSLYAGRVHAFGTRNSNDNRGARVVREALVVAQAILAVVLLSSSLSVGRAFIYLMHINRGFVPKDLLTVNVSLQGTTHQGGARSLAYFEEALGRVRRLPGVQSASATEFLPLYTPQVVLAACSPWTANQAEQTPPHSGFLGLLPNYGWAYCGGTGIHGR